jgi:RNA ligase
MIDILEKYYEDSLLMKQTHPTKDLYIWNYTPKVQYESLWDDITMQCRGLVTNSKGEIVAKPFVKFFNYEEVIHKDLIPWDDEYLYVQEKMDGSLGILFNYEDEWIMATRGSFTSEQSIRGFKILKSKYDLSKFVKGFTYLLELIYPENRIVVNYEQDKITFLSVTSPETELNWHTARAIFNSSGIKEEDIVETEQHSVFSDSLFKLLKEKNTSNKEGFVIRFHPSNFRMKIKFEEYVRLHRILTNVSNINIWESLRDNISFDEILDKVPDEFYNWVRDTKNELINQYETIEKEYQWIFKVINESPNKDLTQKLKTEYRSAFAEYAKKHEHPHLLFSMLDGKDYSKTIWKLIRPTYSKPFKKDEN